MARAKDGKNQTGTYGRKPSGPIGKKPTPRTGGGMKLPTKKVRPPKPTDTGGRKVPKKYKPRLQVDPKKPKKTRKVPGSRGGSRTRERNKDFRGNMIRIGRRDGAKRFVRGLAALRRSRSRR